MRKITIASAKDARKSRVTIEGDILYQVDRTGVFTHSIYKYKKPREIKDILVVIKTDRRILVNGEECDLLDHPNNLLYGNAKEDPKYCSLSFTDDKGKKVIIKNIICCAIVCYDPAYKGTYYQLNANKRIA